MSETKEPEIPDELWSFAWIDQQTNSKHIDSFYRFESKEEAQEYLDNWETNTDNSIPASDYTPVLVGVSPARLAAAEARIAELEATLGYAIDELRVAWYRTDSPNLGRLIHVIEDGLESPD